MPSAVAVSSAVPFPSTIAALPRGITWAAHPTWAPPEMKATSMLLTVTRPGTPACEAWAWPTWRVVRTCTSAATEPGRLTQVEQPDATTDGAAGGTGVPAAAGGRAWAAATRQIAGPPRYPGGAIILPPRLLPLQTCGCLEGRNGEQPESCSRARPDSAVTACWRGADDSRHSS